MDALNKCKMCGGTLIPEADGQTGRCEYCKSLMPLPNARSEEMNIILNRANDFRLANDFDRAILEYENALRIDDTEPDTHWGLFLSRYGVEYVKDPYSQEYKPTIHRISSVSVFDDPDYKAAVKYASFLAVERYQRQAELIETVLKEFLQLSAMQDKYEIFLSYKEADDATRTRTDDSYLAHTLYAELTKEGYKVFFAPRSLTAGLYEPKIYAAIQSARIMIVLGSREEYFNAVWVKNEWTRFAELAEADRNKIIIPVFKDMNPDKLPVRLAKYQALDYNDISFLERLKTMLSEDKNKKVKLGTSETQDAENFIERGYLALDTGSYAAADKFFENALNKDPHNGKAYIGKMLAEFKVSKIEGLAFLETFLESSANYKNVLRFADEKTKAKLAAIQKENYDRLIRKKMNTYSDMLYRARNLNERIIAFNNLFDLERIAGANGQESLAAELAAINKNNTKVLNEIKAQTESTLNSITKRHQTVKTEYHTLNKELEQNTTELQEASAGLQKTQKSKFGGFLSFLSFCCLAAFIVFVALEKLYNGVIFVLLPLSVPFIYEQVRKRRNWHYNKTVYALNAKCSELTMKVQNKAREYHSIENEKNGYCVLLNDINGSLKHSKQK